jgi:RNA polymerase sigma-70 factor (ECF subfamily)
MFVTSLRPDSISRRRFRISSAAALNRSAPSKRSEGEVARFHELIWPHLGHVLRVAQILTGNTADAEDLAQDTMMKAFRAIDRFEAGTDARKWLTTILRNARIDRLRARGAALNDVSLDQLDVDVEDRSSPVQDPRWEKPQELLESLSDAQIIAAMQRLPEEIRWTLLLVDVEGLDHAEAARVLEVPLGTIKSRAHRGRRMLREMLAEVNRDG